ncbi:RepA-like protein [Myrica rubra citlodavirus 1]|nr:RepA-like protein [Myrica rubra citlodavirus 1]
MASSSKAFRFSAKNIFLTYPQTAFPPAFLMERLKQLLMKFNILYILCAREQHANGDPHLHAMVQLEKTFQTQNCRFFDILHMELIHHPSIEPLKSPASARKYLQKENNFIEEGEFNVRRRSPSKDHQQIWREILDEATDEQSFYNMVKERRPTDFVLRWPAISAFAHTHYLRNLSTYIPQFTNFPHLPPHIKEWATTNILCVSKDFTFLNLCNQCHHLVRTEAQDTIKDMYNTYVRDDMFTCNEDIADCMSSNRRSSKSPTGPSPSTSAGPVEQARPNGLDPWVYTIIGQLP